MKSIPRLRTLAATLSLGLLAACAGDPTIQTGDDAETIMGSLNKVDNTRVTLAYVDPNGDYDRYTRAWIAPLDVDNVEIVQPSSSSSIVNRYNREWELTDKDKEALRSAFRESMEKALTAGGAYAIAEGPGDDVLRIEAMITSIAPSGPRDDASTRTVGRSRVYTQGAGGMSIAVMLADGDSGEVLAVIKDTRNSDNSTWGLNNSVTNMSEVRRNFSSWGRQIHDGLLALRARAEGAEAP
jgi:hypothetical protein